MTTNHFNQYMSITRLLSILLVISFVHCESVNASSTPLQPAEQRAWQLLNSAENNIHLSATGRSTLLATLALKQGKIEQAIAFLQPADTTHNRIAALLLAEANRRAALSEAEAAGHYAHAVADDIEKIREAKIDLSEAEQALRSFIRQQHLNQQTVTSPSHPTQPQLPAGLAAAIEAWRTDWQSRNIEQYLHHYHPDFRSGQYDLASWAAHKRRINRRKRYIHVEISHLKAEPPIQHSKFGTLVRVTFRQHYRSSNYNATSNKQLILARQDADQPWLILFEANSQQPLPEMLQTDKQRN